MKYQTIIRETISALIVLATFAIWIHARITGARLDLLWAVVVLAMIVAACYVVFGERIFGKSLDEAKELSEGTDGE